MFGLLKKKIGPVFIKNDSDAEKFIDKMTELSLRADGQLKKDIEKQIKLANYGLIGEKNIIFELKNSDMDMLILHDLYLEYEDLQAQIDFINHELELLTKKNSGDKKPTATQLANEALKSAIVEGMEVNRLYSVTEMIKEIPALAGLNPQKVSPLANQLVEANLLVKTVEKRRSFFQLAEV